MSMNRTTGLRINVAQLLKGPTGAVRRLQLYDEIDDLDEDLIILAPLTGMVTLIRTADGILVTAPLRTVVELECSRCLEPFEGELKLEIEEEFEPSIDIHTGAKLPVRATEQDATIIDEHHILDLTEVVRQTIFLALPMSPACQLGCAGLCPVCGKNLNEGRCQCAADDTDPRLEVLRQLL
ncbi:MAG TPA: DUF177 domain-containing protein [Anaerolineae bacterium]|nr:DUF177 domain-containing protein [Anaerolineae bacterium]